MKLNKILAITLCLACFLTSGVFANSSDSTGITAEDRALSDLKELSIDDLLLLAQTSPVDYYEINPKNVLGRYAVNPAMLINDTNAIEENITFQETWATYDYDTVPDWAKENVLIARRSIIYSEGISWAVNGAARIMNEDGSLEDVPEYSDLFPYWDLKQICDFNEMQISPSVAVDNFDVSDTLTTMSTRYRIFSNEKYTIHVPNALDVHLNIPGCIPPRIKGLSDWRSIGVWASWIGGSSYNIGGYNETRRVDAFNLYLVAGQGLRVYNVANCTIAFRFSSYDYWSIGDGIFSADYERWGGL